MPNEISREWIEEWGKRHPDSQFAWMAEAMLADWDAEQARDTEAEKCWEMLRACNVHSGACVPWDRLLDETQKAWSKFLAELREARQAEKPECDRPSPWSRRNRSG